jgi:hypothetical protein
VTPDDEVRLTVPADADMAAVVVAAIGAVARSAGFPSGAVDEVRELAAADYLSVLERGDGDQVEVQAWARRPEWSFEIRRGEATEVRSQGSGG